MTMAFIYSESTVSFLTEQNIEANFNTLVWGGKEGGKITTFLAYHPNITEIWFLNQLSKFFSLEVIH